MSFRVIDCDQRSAEWHRARAGRLTGSRACDMLAAIKSGEAAARRDLRAQLVVERLTGLPQDDGNGYVNAVMQRGIDLEPMARLAYEALTGFLVETTGFLAHEQYMAGCSLDGHVGPFSRIVSLKCPKSATHLRYWRDGKMPTEHVPQMLHELWVTGAPIYDFVSFDDRFPPELQTFYVSVPRDGAAVEDYARKALSFLEEVTRDEQAVRTMATPRAMLEASA